MTGPPRLFPLGLLYQSQVRRGVALYREILPARSRERGGLDLLLRRPIRHRRRFAERGHRRSDPLQAGPVNGDPVLQRASTACCPCFRDAASLLAWSSGRAGALPGGTVEEVGVQAVLQPSSTSGGSLPSRRRTTWRK